MEPTDSQREEIARIEEPTDAGRRLDVGAFVLADPFDTILCRLSADYLEAAYRRILPVLATSGMAPADLSWGWLHPCESWAPDLDWEPGSFTGWTSRELARFDLRPQYASVDAELRSGDPALACAVTWRSRKWAIAPDDYALALRLIDCIWVDEPTDWDPGLIVREHPGEAGAWIDVARAILNGDQNAADHALEEARGRYSQAGFSVMLRGYLLAAPWDSEVVLPGE